MAAVCPDTARALARVHHTDWFAVQVVSRRETAVASFLREKGYEEFVPIQPARGRRRARDVDKAVFPGYVFCRMEDPAAARLYTTPGFIRIVGSAGTPLPIPREEIEGIRQALAAGLYVEPTEFYQVGDLVRVLDGPLAGVQGRLVRHATQSALVLSVTVLQRAVSVHVSADAVELIARGPSR
jgi:transcription termination/antitermination protein NusG